MCQIIIVGVTRVTGEFNGSIEFIVCLTGERGEAVVGNAQSCFFERNVQRLSSLPWYNYRARLTLNSQNSARRLPSAVIGIFRLDEDFEDVAETERWAGSRLVA